jgi:hypothetical protein
MEHLTNFARVESMIVVLHVHCSLGKYASILSNILNIVTLLVVCDGTV